MYKDKVNRDFYARDTEIVAQDLLGKILVREMRGIILSGYIVETEAYTGDDPACHAFKGKTPRTAPLFGEVGHAYIYFIYGNHFCLNIVARNAAVKSGGVLIRALEPLEGIEYMKERRRVDNLYNLTNGPGKVTQAMAITKNERGIDVTQSSSLYILSRPAIDPRNIKSGPRIGISKATEKKWRFWIAHNPWVSK